MRGAILHDEDEVDVGRMEICRVLLVWDFYETRHFGVYLRSSVH
jgi:hypothetical protein